VGLEPLEGCFQCPQCPGFIASLSLPPQLWPPPFALQAPSRISKTAKRNSTPCAAAIQCRKQAAPQRGPNLLGVVGRKAASEPEFTKYSPALKAPKLTWSKKTLNKFLVNPGEIPARTSDEHRWLLIGKIGEKHWSAIITRRGDNIRLLREAIVKRSCWVPIADN
jgi:hypothetical protein